MSKTAKVRRALLVAMTTLALAAGLAVTVPLTAMAAPSPVVVRPSTAVTADRLPTT